jgi:hypothetical protein
MEGEDWMDMCCRKVAGVVLYGTHQAFIRHEVIGEFTGRAMEARLFLGEAPPDPSPNEVEMEVQYRLQRYGHPVK